MKKYKLVYQAEVSVVVEASSDEVAVDKAQKVTLKIADKDGVYLKPLDSKIEIKDIE